MSRPKFVNSIPLRCWSENFCKHNSDVYTLSKILLGSTYRMQIILLKSKTDAGYVPACVGEQSLPMGGQHMKLYCNITDESWSRSPRKYKISSVAMRLVLVLTKRWTADCHLIVNVTQATVTSLRPLEHALLFRVEVSHFAMAKLSLVLLWTSPSQPPPRWSAQGAEHGHRASDLEQFTTQLKNRHSSPAASGACQAVNEVHVPHTKATTAASNRFLTVPPNFHEIQWTKVIANALGNTWHKKIYVQLGLHTTVFVVLM